MNEGLTNEDVVSGNLSAIQRYVTAENVNDEVTYKRTLVDLCCVHGHLHCVKWLAEEMHATIGDKALCDSIQNKKYDCLCYVITHGTNLNIHNINLNQFVAFPSILKLFIKHGADVHYSFFGMTPLDTAIAFNKRTISGQSIKYLLRAGARLENVCHEQQRNIKPWMRIQQTEYVVAARKCSDAALALYRVMRIHGCPRDLTQYVCHTLVMKTGGKKMWRTKSALARVMRQPEFLSSICMVFLIIMQVFYCFLAAQ